ncbi:hypothetical protein F0L17_21015 [Streptomyces sp. TRM43335]|uniref:Uncharacterized protein n=1 Tax=Streptomyces taklimakanensis TaxID=2569853 RepID=A0A6G2BGY7_9ACTN|nr:hypothetical protein [Streptomyces taklimakanensis]MTE21547.1 hypothetical protein [Streptomyces taklimakanensis]
MTTTPPSDSPPLLLVADHVAGAVHLLTLPRGELLTSLTGRHASEHAGFLALPGDRVAFVDDRAGELVVLAPFEAVRGGNPVAATVPVAVPAEHLAAAPDGRHLVVTTGLGRNEEPWSDLLTAVDLAAPGGPYAVRVRTRPGEPGAAVPAGTPGTSGDGGPLAVVRHREPGSLAVHRHADLLAAGPGCPPAGPPLAELPLPDDGHGDAHDPATGRLFTATGAGVHRTRCSDGGPTVEPPLPWEADGRSGGRGYFLRIDVRRRLLWSCLRGGPSAPTAWPAWTNDAWWHHLDTGRTGRVELGEGLVFRMAVAEEHVAYARCHPDGDELVVLAAAPSGAGRPTVAARVPLPPMDGAPRPGASPWDGVQRRALAASPGAPWVAVSRGGHGEIHLIDAASGVERARPTLPTPLDEGGRLALLVPGDGAHLDPAGR